MFLSLSGQLLISNEILLSVKACHPLCMQIVFKNNRHDDFQALEKINTPAQDLSPAILIPV